MSRYFGTTTSMELLERSDKKKEISQTPRTKKGNPHEGANLYFRNELQKYL